MLVLLLLIRYAWINRGSIFERAGPLLYPLLFAMVAYSITVGNAGTGFSYRSHLVTLGICAMAVLRERFAQSGPSPHDSNRRTSKIPSTPHPAADGLSLGLKPPMIS